MLGVVHASHASLVLFMPRTISYPESSGFLVSGATPGRLWGHRKNSIFLIGCSVTVSIVLPQKSCRNKIRCPQSLPGVAPLTKKPEDSGYEIVPRTPRTSASHASLARILYALPDVKVCLHSAILRFSQNVIILYKFMLGVLIPCLEPRVMPDS